MRGVLLVFATIRGVSVWYSIRSAIVSSTDAAGGFFLANVMWAFVAATGMLVGSAWAPGHLLLLLVVPVTCGIVRMAGHAVRKDHPRLRHFLAGLRYRWWQHLLLGVLQFLVLVMAIVNVGIGMRGENLLAALVAIVGLYVGVAAVVLGVAAWPLLLDPDREGRAVLSVLRVALAVVLRRPFRTGLVALVVVVLALGVSQVLLLGLLLPGFGALVAAHFVIPTANRLEADVRRRRRRSARQGG